MSEPIALEARHLTKVFGRRPKEAAQRLAAGESRTDVAGLGTAAVIDADFEVRKGEIFVVMGLSGSGKSTLIRMLNGLLEPTAGEVTVMGKPITGVPAAELRRIRQEHVSMVFQHFALLPHLTVLDNAAYGLEVQGVPFEERRERAQRVVERVGLSGWESSLPSELSGGMQQRVGLARALASDTDILLMDEAFSALDPLIRREMQEQLVELQQELGTTIIFITHDLNEAMFLGDRIAVMRDGRTVQIGSPDDILTDPANDYVAQFVQDVDRARVLTAGGVMEAPRAVVGAAAGPRGALRVMRDLQTSAAFVVTEGRRLLGVIDDRTAIRAVRDGKRDLKDLLREANTVTREQTLADIIDYAAESPLPVAVLDDNDRLIGVVPRVALLTALSSESTQTSEIPIMEPMLTVPVSLMDETIEQAGALEHAAGAGSTHGDSAEEASA